MKYVNRKSRGSQPIGGPVGGPEAWTRRNSGRKPPLPKARYEAPDPWKDADRKQLLQFLKTPSGTKFLFTLHDLAAGRALSVAERTPHGHGITAGMSVMLGLIENMASEAEEEAGK